MTAPGPSCQRPTGNGERVQGCFCDYNTGPEETCPQHGRTYAEWIERGDVLQKRCELLTLELTEACAALAGAVTPQVDALMREHWLVFALGGMPVVVGCHCGFKADVDSDSGYGDSVVRHLFEVAISGGTDAR